MTVDAVIAVGALAVSVVASMWRLASVISRLEATVHELHAHQDACLAEHISHRAVSQHVSVLEHRVSQLEDHQ